MVKLGIEIEEEQTMERIEVKTRKAVQDKVKELRADGYMIVTFGYDFTEMEKGNELIVIEKIR
jgi:biotin operon repressor